MNESEITDKLSCLICFKAKILFIPLPIYYTIDKTRKPWQQKVDLLLYPKALILRNSSGLRDYFYGIIQLQDLRQITIKSQGSLNLFVALTLLLSLLSYVLTFFTIKLFFYPELTPTDSFPLIAGCINGLLVGFLLILALPRYCLYLKTDAELYVLTVKNDSKFTTMKSFADKVTENIERSL